ncbi:tyrosine-type recombinase/integrase [Solidesulfovibrio sp. C21]
MPSCSMKNGKRRWRGAVMVAGVSRKKWFEDDSKASERAAAAWEMETKEQLEKEQAEAAKAAEQMIRLDSWTTLRFSTEALMCSKTRDSEKTHDEKKSVFKRFVKAAGPDVLLESVDVDFAETYLDTQAEERSGNAANKDRKNLSWAWDWAKKRFRKQGFPQGDNPFRMVDPYPENRQPRYVPAEEDFDKVLALVDGQDRALLLAALHLAARRGELFRLRWTDVDFTGNRVRLRTRKTRTGSWRDDWLPMTMELREALRSRWQDRKEPGGHVFLVEGEHLGHGFENQHVGKPFKSRQHWLGKLCDKAKVEPFGFHAIRHLAAIMLYHAGYSVATIQAMLRHENAGTTEIYLKCLGLDPGKLRDAVEDVFSRKGAGKVIEFKPTHDPKKNAPEAGTSEAF